MAVHYHVDRSLVRTVWQNHKVPSIRRHHLNLLTHTLPTHSAVATVYLRWQGSGSSAAAHAACYLLPRNGAQMEPSALGMSTWE
jgi:hypothetical protein